MAVSAKKLNRAYEILRDYDGDNPYLIRLQKKLYVDKESDIMTDFNVNFVIDSENFSPKKINKIL